MAAEEQKQIQINVPPLGLNVPYNVVQLMLRGLAKLPIEEAGEAYSTLAQANQANIDAATAAAKAANEPRLPAAAARAVARSKKTK